jgi:hypothetical protein
MKNMQSLNAGFILTSISYTDQKINNYRQQREQLPAETKRSITKYDYCLPPDDKKLLPLKK